MIVLYFKLKSSANLFILHWKYIIISLEIEKCLQNNYIYKIYFTMKINKKIP